MGTPLTHCERLVTQFEASITNAAVNVTYVNIFNFLVE